MAARTVRRYDKAPPDRVGGVGPEFWRTDVNQQVDPGLPAALPAEVWMRPWER